MELGTLVLVILGWIALYYRIHAEEQMLSQHVEWPVYIDSVRYRLLPGFW